MDFMIKFTILFYILSSAGYGMYLFLQKNYLYRVGYFLLAAGFGCHFFVISFGLIKSGVIPVLNLRETLLFAGWTIAGVFLVISYKINLKILGIYAAPLAAIVMIIACNLPPEPASSGNTFKNIWLVLHIFTIFTGESSLALACGAGILYLVQENAIKTKRYGFFFKRLPSLELLDSAGYTCLIVGFTLTTIGLATGFIYAKSVWGKFWSWDPKEIWSAITWLIYAALLHERLAIGWRGKRAAVMAVIGFLVVLFTFLGVNFLLSGHHNEFTRW